MLLRQKKCKHRILKVRRSSGARSSRKPKQRSVERHCLDRKLLFLADPIQTGREAPRPGSIERQVCETGNRNFALIVEDVMLNVSLLSSLMNSGSTFFRKSAFDGCTTRNCCSADMFKTADIPTISLSPREVTACFKCSPCIEHSNSITCFGPYTSTIHVRFTRQIGILDFDLGLLCER